MKSMTGYAKTEVLVGQKKVSIEIKTLNSKQLDLIVKLPTSYKHKELEIRSILSQLERGKIDLYVAEEKSAEMQALNSDIVVARYQQLRSLAESLNAPTDNLLDSIVRMPDVWDGTVEQEIDDSEWEAMQQALQKAVAECDRFRAEEGAVLEKDFVNHVDAIEQKLRQIPQYEEQRITTARERIQKYMSDFVIKDIDSNRFEQEIIYYLEKLDITEEKVRLQKHIDYFRQVMRDEPTCGKKLAFVAQEMGREINTTGSKANHVEIQKLVVEMKDELEKIKEQLGNIL